MVSSGKFKMKDNVLVTHPAEILPGGPDLSPAPLHDLINQTCYRSGGWLPFDRFMSTALYTPGLGYYANDLVKLGAMPLDGSDFVTAPELSRGFGRALGCQVAQALQTTQTHRIWEFGAGTGALAEQVLTELHASGVEVACYTIVDVSGALRQRQQARLGPFGARVQWADSLPPSMEGVVIGNEVLDAMPVQLLCRKQGVWYERGVSVAAQGERLSFEWSDRPTMLRPPADIPGDHDYLTEIHSQAEAFMRTLAERLHRGAAFFIDYGFPESEYYHPQRHMGTLMCHRLHRSDADPLTDIGLKDITAHVNFTGVALAAQEAGLQVMGYTSQGRFLINAGLLQGLVQASLAERAACSRLINEHEMGELFKVLALVPMASAEGWLPLGFTQGDRTHTL